MMEVSGLMSCIITALHIAFKKEKLSLSGSDIPERNRKDIDSFYSVLFPQQLLTRYLR